MRTILLDIITYPSLISRRLYVAYIRPISTDEDRKRTESILNIVLLLLLGVMSVFNIVIVTHTLTEGEGYVGISPFFMMSITFYLFFLYWMSRKGFTRIASQALVVMLVVGCVYGQFMWGSDLPAVLLSWAMIIVMASILIGAGYAVYLSVFITLLNGTLAYLEDQSWYTPERSWLSSPFLLADGIEYGLILLIISALTWFANREIYRALARARISEKALKAERDFLEVRVEEKTQELRLSQLDKINNMYRFVEFGRLASGLFHDIASPLTALSLQISGLEKGHSRNDTSLSSLVDNVQSTSRRMTHFLSGAKKQMRFSAEEITFSINDEITQSVELLTSKGRSHNVTLFCHLRKNIVTMGNPVIFSHIITNLLSNAIDAYVDLSQESTRQSKTRSVHVSADKIKQRIIIKVKDFGIGIPPELHDKIFDPFFTTKEHTGCGIGLSATLHSLKKYFTGTINFKSNKERGTTFIISFPQRQDSETSLEASVQQEDAFSNEGADVFV